MNPLTYLIIEIFLIVYVIVDLELFELEANLDIS